MTSIKLYIESLLSKKLFLISHLNIVFVTIILLFSANVFTDNYIQIENSEAFLIDYLYQGILFIKINMIAYIIVLVHQTKQVSGIMIQKTIEESRFSTISKYSLSSLVILCVILSIFYIIFLIVGYYLTEHFYYHTWLLLYGRLLLFVCVNYMMVLVLYFLNDSMYLSLSYFILYLISIMSAGFMIHIDEVNIMIKILHLYVSDLLLFDGLTYQFLYSDLYQASMALLVFFLLVWRYNKIDLL